MVRLNGICEGYLAATCRIWKKQASMCSAHLFIDIDWELNLRSLFSEPFHFVLLAPFEAMSTRNSTFVLTLMKIRA